MSLSSRARTGRHGVVAFAALWLAVGAVACSHAAEKSAHDTTRVAAQSSAPDSANDSTDESDSTETLDTSKVTHIDASAAVNAHAPAVAKISKLSPLADSIAATLVFELKTQRTFLAASRAKRVLVDLGRVDAPLKTPARLKAYEEAVKVLSPVRIGDRFRLHGSWGQDDAVVQSYDQWNGRIVAVLEVPPNVDSLARAKAPLTALAVRADSAMPAVVDSTCRDDSVSVELAARLVVVRDSLLTVLQNDTVKMAPRLMKLLHAQKSQAIGCFAKWRAMLFVAQWAGDYEYNHQLAVLVDTAGKVTPMRVNDLRFKVHDVLGVLDVDGDSVDDVALRGRGPRIGGTVILRLNPEKKRLEYVAGGFAWESF
ncbi:MAG TPA: hypothetical protein VN717_05260 [Gemmatimonadaceae bacterium]|nr:hypothetical protein [Gemmatimonadaceae bacterium]